MLTGLFRQRGITMVEIMVSIAIVSLVLGIGIPNFTSWLQNTQVRATAESVLAGLQLARAEAVRQNTKARFQLTGGNAGMASWAVSTGRLDRTDCPSGTDLFPCPIQTGSARAGGQTGRIGVTTAALSSTNYASAIAAGTGMGSNPTVIFDAFGRTDSTVTNITRIDVTSAAYSGARRMVITISDSGMARLCDPALSASNSRGCS
jgi:type IV fimbrial biogenesis protein FimT